jgi:hypothetical protein
MLHKKYEVPEDIHAYIKHPIKKLENKRIFEK